MWTERSAPASCIASSSAAETALVLEVRCFFFIACSPDGNDPNAVPPHSDEGRPHRIADSSDDLGPRPIARPSRDLQTVGVAPQGLSVDEVDAVLQIDCRLCGVELEVHLV